MPIRAASRRRVKLRAALAGPSKSGKTRKALILAHEVMGVLRSAGQLAGNGKVCVIDSEHGRSDQYADLFPEYGINELFAYDPPSYINALREVAEAGYSFTIVDQISHEWAGKGGVLEYKTRAEQQSGGKLNSYTAWGLATPLHDQFIEALLAHPTHLIATMRSKIDYELINVDGKMKPQKLGMAPVQRDNTEYEFDIFANINMNHFMEMECRGSLADEFNGRSFGPDETEEVGRRIGRWLTEGVALHDASKPGPAPAEEVAAAMAAAREVGYTESEVFGLLQKHFQASSFNDMTPESFAKFQKSMAKKLSDRKRAATAV